MIYPDYKEFLRLSRDATLVPVAKSISADLLTPVSAFLAVAEGEPDAFLLESVEGGEKIGRYTFLGVRPFLRLESRGAEITIERGGIKKVERRTGNVFEAIKELLQQHRPARVEGLPPFTAGAVGYCAYDIVRRLENIGEHAADDLDVPDCVLMFFRPGAGLLITCGTRSTLWASADVTRDSPKLPMGGREGHRADREKTCRGVEAGVLAQNGDEGKTEGKGAHFEGEVSGKRAASEGVHRCGRHFPGGAFAAVGFRAGSISAGFVPRAADGESVAIYVFLALRRREKSGRNARARFVSRNAGACRGTKAGIPSDRGDTSAGPGRSGRRGAGKEDAQRREGTRGTRDAGGLRAQRPGPGQRVWSVQVRDLMYVERYSHVMHLVSALEGRLRPELNAMDAFAACFPAGTLSGAPKVRAMQIIEELEPTRRGVYGGSVLYADFAGNLDSCIAIRTLLMKGKKAYLQAGAGIVADSDPQREFEETENKARAVLRAVEMARAENRD